MHTARQLKIKIKSLAAEAQMIRKEERKVLGYGRHINRATGLIGNGSFHGEYHDLHAHRTWDVRREARSSLLAYGFLRERPFRTMEQEGSKAPDWDRIESLATKYGNMDKRLAKQRLAAWSS
tara:strand:+ start:19400 stop:19765 length:366 start_codon:yes stop_codon:yes gene_type:complete